MSIIDRLKQLGWLKLVTIGLSGLVVILGMTASVHGLVASERVVTSTQPSLSPLPSLLPSPSSTPVECPDRIEHDQQPAPLWIKGSERKRISGEDEALIMAACSSPSPVAKASSAPSTTKVAAKAVSTSSLNSTSTPIPTPTPTSTPTSTPSPTPAVAACKSDAIPVFTNQLIDPALVTNILTPPNIAVSSGHLKTHSYIDTSSSAIPIYAPVDMELFKGDFYTGGPYYFDFRISCEVTLRVAHVTEPIESIKQAFGSDPEAAKEIEIKPSIKIKAGEHFAYSGGPPHVLNNGLDFGVYNTTKPNRYTESQTSSIYTTAVCPYDYFTDTLRTAYKAKFNLVTHQGMTRDGESFCQ